MNKPYHTILATISGFVQPSKPI